MEDRPSPPSSCDGSSCRPLRVLIGGTALHLIVGIKIMWGSITPYVTSYLRQFDSTVTFHNTLHVYTATFLGQALSMYHGGLLEKKLGPRIPGFLGAIMISLGTLLASYSTRLSHLIVCEGIVGLGIGIAYSPPIICCFKHYPSNKGIVSGVITTGTGAGPFLFNIIACLYVNPHGVPFDEFGMYDPASDIVGRVPGMFRLLAVCFAISGFIGAALLVDPPSIEVAALEGPPKKQRKKTLETIESGFLLDHPLLGSSTDSSSSEESPRAFVVDERRPPLAPRTQLLQGSTEVDTLLKNEMGCDQQVVATYTDLLRIDLPNNASLGNGSGSRNGSARRRLQKKNRKYQIKSLTTEEMVKEPICWLVIGSAISTGAIGLFIVGTYKSFAVKTISDDHFLTIVGSLGCLCTGAFRTLWGTLADKFGTFKTVEVVSYLNPLLLLLYTFTVQSRTAFAILFCALMALWGVNYCLFPSIAAMLFGEEHMGTNYGFIFFVFGVLSTVCIDSCGYTSLSFETLNVIFAALGLAGGIMATRLEYLTSDIDHEEAEEVMKHHRATSSVASIF